MNTECIIAVTRFMNHQESSKADGRNLAILLLLSALISGSVRAAIT